METPFPIPKNLYGRTDVRSYSDTITKISWLDNFPYPWYFAEALLLNYVNSQDEPLVSDASVMEKARVPLVGDMLDRERVTGAKKTPLDCDSAVERFQNIVECPALWHAKQAFLSVG